jgi:xyloglucan-specific exo-beta-1,4-glucanase
MRMNATRINVVLIGLLLVVAGTASHRRLDAQTSSVPYSWKNAVINGGGFVTGIVFHPNEPNLIYARTDIGGVYRWNQTAGRWIPLLDWIGWDQWGYTGVWSVALDPRNPNAVYAAVGTYTNGWDPGNAAVLKSTDRGVTWSVSPLPFKGHGNMPGRGSGERLAVDPNNGNVLYLGATGSQTDIYGLWRSTDGGGTWSEVTSFPKAKGDWKENPDDFWNYLNTYQGILWVEFDPRTVSGGVTQTVYVGIATKNHPTVYRSTNGGSSWEAVPGQPVDFPDSDPEDDMHLMPKKGKFDAANGILYVTYGHRVGPYETARVTFTSTTRGPRRGRRSAPCPTTASCSRGTTITAIPASRSTVRTRTSSW